MIGTILHTYKSAIITGALSLSVMAQAQFQQTAKLVGEREGRAEFGTSVAMSENYLVVGASRESIAAGAAYVFKKENDGSWAFSQKLVANDAVQMAEYGGSVKMKDRLMVVASGRADVGGFIRAGALYVYEFNDNGNWDFIEKLSGSTLSTDRLLAVNPGTMEIDENIIIAGAPGENTWTGAVYIFEKGNNGWEETQKISNPEGNMGMNFGSGISFMDGILVIGASGDNDGAGSAFIYEKGNDGVWTFKQKITASTPQPNSYFGTSVSIYENQLVVGAYAEGNPGTEKASAYIFEMNDAGTWTEIQKILGPTSNEDTFFGWACKMNGDKMLISTPHIWGVESGKIFLYKKGENGLWTESLTIQTTEDMVEDAFGWSIDLYGDNILVGAARDDFDENGENELGDAGSAFVFTLDDLGVVDGTLSTNQVKLYPNPAENEINIFSKESIQSVEIYSLSGKKIISTNQNTINISSLPKGTYLVKVKTSSGKINTQKFIKK